MMVTLTESLVRQKAEEYERSEPLYLRERDHLETFPDAFTAGEFTWKDSEWVVRWYFRRHLGGYPHADREAVEDAYGDNDYDAVTAAIRTAINADDPATKVRQLTTLSGVDVPIASAFLLFADPENYLVVGRSEWSVLHAAGELGEPYPDPPSPEEYEAYLETCRELAVDLDCSLWTLYEALWRLAKGDDVDIRES